ncbi:hypothetical protein ABZ131_00300 [Providencia rettgeri]
MNEIKDTRNWKCFFGMHQWVTISKNPFRENYGGGDFSEGTLYHLQCVHCGKIQGKKVMI